MVNTRSGKSTIPNLPNLEHESQNSSQIESQHGTHRGAEGEIGNHAPESEDVTMHAIDEGEDPIVNEEDYISPGESEDDNQLPDDRALGALTPRTRSHMNRGKYHAPQAMMEGFMKGMSEMMMDMRKEVHNLSKEIVDLRKDVEGKIAGLSEDMDNKAFDLTPAMIPTSNERKSGLEENIISTGDIGQKQVSPQSEEKGVPVEEKAIPVTAADMMMMTAALTGTKFPKLANKLHLDRHLDSLNGMLSEMDLLTTEGELKPRYVHRLNTLIGESLTEVSEVSQAFEHLRIFGHGWKEIQHSLSSQFCSRASVRRDLEVKLENLKFMRPYPKFIQIIKEIYYIHSRFYSDNGERRALVRRIIKVMPSFLARPIIKQLMLINEDWAIAKPFPQFISMLESHLHVAEECDSATTPSRTRINEDYKPRDDKLGAIFEKKKPWLEDWVKSFDGVLYCCGPGHRDQLQKITNQPGILEIKLFDKGTKGPYALIGYKGSPPKVTCTTRPFILKPKN